VSALTTSFSVIAAAPWMGEFSHVIIDISLCPVSVYYRDTADILLI
jgi:hypothetical protein